jgi:hypothetical protein
VDDRFGRIRKSATGRQLKSSGGQKAVVLAGNSVNRFASLDARPKFGCNARLAAI